MADAAHDWIVRWGESHPERWLASQYGFKQKEVALDGTQEYLTLIEPRPPHAKYILKIYRLITKTDDEFQVALCELTNGVYVVAWKLEKIERTIVGNSFTSIMGF